MTRERAATDAQLAYLARLAAETGQPAMMLDPTTDMPPVDEEAEQRAQLATPADVAAGHTLGTRRLGATARLTARHASVVIRELRFERAMSR